MVGTSVVCVLSWGEVGVSVGIAVGTSVGAAVVGVGVGTCVGAAVVGVDVGASVGAMVGKIVGDAEGGRLGTCVVVSTAAVDVVVDDDGSVQRASKSVDVVGKGVELEVVFEVVVETTQWPGMNRYMESQYAQQGLM